MHPSAHRTVHETRRSELEAAARDYLREASARRMRSDGGVPRRATAGVARRLFALFTRTRTAGDAGRSPEIRGIADS